MAGSETPSPEVNVNPTRVDRVNVPCPADKVT